MFNSEEKKEISRLLDKAYARHLPAYQKEIGALLDAAETAGKTDLKQEAEQAMAQYLERVGRSVDSELNKAENEDIKDRYLAARKDPSLCGATPEADKPLTAGELFQLLFYAYTGKKGSGKDAQRQDFLLGAYVDRALKQLERPI